LTGTGAYLEEIMNRGKCLPDVRHSANVVPSCLPVSESVLSHVLVLFLLILSSAFASAACNLPSQSGIACVQSNSKDIVAQSGTIAFPSNNTQGNLIVVIARAEGADTSTPSDSLGNSYVSDPSIVNVVPAGGRNRLSIYYAQNIAAGANTVTLSASGANTIRVAIFEYSGLATSNALDQAAAATGTSSTPASPSVATTSSPELVIGALQMNTHLSITQGTGYTLERCVDSCTDGSLGTEDRILSASSSIAATWTAGSSVTWSSIVATFLSSGGKPGENAYCTGTSDSTCFTGSQTDGPAALPTSGMYTGTNGTPAPGTTVTLPCGGNLQTYINNLTAGQTLVIPAVCSGVQNVIAGQFTLPVVSGASSSQWNWIETDQTNAASFPAEHTRATPCAINQSSVNYYPSYSCSSPAVLMPKIQGQSGGTYTLRANAGAHFWRFIGLEIASPSSATQSTLVDLSNGVDHFIFDRVLMHGNPLACTLTGTVYSCSSKDTTTAIGTDNSTNVALINSWAWDFLCPQGTCTDAHAIGGGTGASATGPVKLYGNLLASAGESFLMGGGGQGAGSNTPVAADIEIRANHSYKPVSWALCTACSGMHPEYKNNGELKNANRALIEGNVFENSWTGWQTDQSGFQFLLTPKNQSTFDHGTASSDGSGNLTALSGTFPSDVVSSYCAIPNHCRVKYSGTVYYANTWTDSTHISLQSPYPPVMSSASFDAFEPGLCPTCIVENITVRFNEFRNSKNGIQFATALSDGGDVSQGMNSASIHDNLLHGITNLLSNSTNGDADGKCFGIGNGQSNPINVRTYTFAHNTCASGDTGPYGYSGLESSLDTTDTTTDGTTGAYFDNETIENNIGPAGGLVTYKLGTTFPGGLVAGLAQQGCTPPVTGTTCTWTYTHNVLGIGQWLHQLNNTPFPSTNQTCDSANDTCFPSGTAFTSLFTNYNGPNGQPGYLGTYTLVGTFKGSGTDGKDIGVSDWASFNNDVREVWHSTTYTAASITSTSPLPPAPHGTAYSFTFAGTSASDMQVWTDTDTTFPVPGLSLSRAGVLSGTPTSAGTYTLHIQLMDAAQQYASRTFSLTVN
jgi:hypothetical protein